MGIDLPLIWAIIIIFGVMMYVVMDGFDPEADPLDDMPAVRLAMEQGGHLSASSHRLGKNR